MKNWKIWKVLLVVATVIFALWLFKSMVMGNFESTDSLLFILLAFFIAGVVCTIIGTFAPYWLQTGLIKAVLIILGLFTVWSIMVSTSEVAAESNKATATGWYTKVSEWIWPGDAYNAEVRLQSDMNCDAVTAEKRNAEESDLLAKFKASTDNDVDAYVKARDAIRKKYDATVLCKTSKFEINLPKIPQTSTSTNGGSIDTSPREMASNITIDGQSKKWVKICDGDCAVSVSGSIDYGGETATPDGSPRLGDRTATVSGISFGVLIAKVGKNGKPFQVGSSRAISAGGNPVYAIVNDSHYGDNKGFYTVSRWSL